MSLENLTWNQIRAREAYGRALQPVGMEARNMPLGELLPARAVRALARILNGVRDLALDEDVARKSVRMLLELHRVRITEAGLEPQDLADILFLRIDEEGDLSRFAPYRRWWA